MEEMAQRYKIEGTDAGEFQVRVKTGPTINDRFDLVEALQRVVDEVEKGKKSGPVVDADGAKVGEYGYV